LRPSSSSFTAYYRRKRPELLEVYKSALPRRLLSSFFNLLTPTESNLAAMPPLSPVVKGSLSKLPFTMALTQTRAIYKLVGVSVVVEESPHSQLL
jgi:hypothetical protein